MAKIIIPKTLTELVKLLVKMGKDNQYAHISTATAYILYNWKTIIKQDTEIVIFDNRGGKVFEIWEGDNARDVIKYSKQENYVKAYRNEIGGETIKQFPYKLVQYDNTVSDYIHWSTIRENGLADFIVKNMRQE